MLKLADTSLILINRSPSNVNENDITPLHTASYSGQVEVYKLIMSNTQDKNPEDSDGWTPLHYAAEDGWFELCKLILLQVDDKNPSDNMGKTPRCIAQDRGHLNIVDLINSHLKNPPSKKLKIEYYI